jgi:hypothetical protein
MVVGSFMMIGTLRDAKKLIVKLGLVSEERLSQLEWMVTREVVLGTFSQRSWFLNVEKSKVIEAMEAAACHEYIRAKTGERWEFCPPTRSGPERSTRTAPAQWPPMPQPAATGTSGLKPGMTPAGRQENERREGLRRQAEWLKAATQPQSGVEEVKEVLETFKKEMKAFVDQALSAKAAASPAADAAQDDGGASERALEARVQGLELKVGELTASKAQLQEDDFKCFAKGKDTDYENFQLKAKIQGLEDRLRPMMPLFVTPNKEWPPGATPLPAWMHQSPPVVGGAPLLVLVWVPPSWHQGD